MIELEKYFTGIADGKIVACEKMKRVSDMLLEQFYNPGEFHFDSEIANRHIEFIESFCYVPAGDIGQKIVLEEFQKARLQAVFGFVDDNNLRQYNECMIIEGRKNGKTTECATVELDMLVNDQEGAPEIYNIATKLDQARKGFVAADNMRQQSPMLRKHVKKRAHDIYFKYNMGFIKAMASNTSSLDSLDSHCVIIDELAAIKNRDLYDLMKQSMGARAQPLLFCITTNGFVRGGIFDAQYEYATNILEKKADNKRFLPFIYELDSPDEWDKEDCWIKANPGLGTIKKVEYLREMVQKAKDDPSFKPTVMVKDFNLPQTSEQAYSVDNTALIAPLEGKYGEICGYYPLLTEKCRIVPHEGKKYVSYDFGNGNHGACELERMGIMNQFQYKNELFGESNACLRPTLDLITTQNQGIIEGVKSSASLRFMAKLAQALKQKDIEEERKSFRENNLSSSNNGGVLLFDQKYEEVKQIDSKPFVVNPVQMKQIKENVFNYFGTNEAILQNKFNSDEWSAYYEGKIEPFAIEASLVHTNMTFSEHEIAFGNQIMFTANRLQYMSNTEKLNTVTQLFDRGFLTHNQGLEIFNMSPVEGGDKRYIRKEYALTDNYNEGGNSNATVEGEGVQNDSSVDDSTGAEGKEI